MRSDDPAPVFVAATLLRLAGRPIGSLTWNERRQLVTWRCGRAEDVLELLRFVPPRLFLRPRGRLEAEVLAEMALSVARGDRRVADQDARAAAVAQRAAAWASLSVPYDAPLPLHDEVAAVTDGEFRGWLQGFFLAEGWAGLEPAQRRFRLRAEVGQRLDGLAALELIQARVGAGTIAETHFERPGWPYHVWRVSDHAGATALARWLLESPLPALLPRARAFELWGQAIDIRAAAPRGSGPRPGLAINPDLKRMHDALVEATAFQGPHPLVTGLSARRAFVVP
jgi:hypothetical protein